MASLKSIGANIAKLRKARGLTQEDLTGIVDMDRSFLSFIENGHKNFSVQLLIDLAKALECEVAELL